MKLRTCSSRPPTCAWRTIAAGSAFSAATSKLPDRRISRQVGIDQPFQGSCSVGGQVELVKRRITKAQTRRTDALIRTWRDAK
jgi:hypothetical protein